MYIYVYIYIYIYIHIYIYDISSLRVKRIFQKRFVGNLPQTPGREALYPLLVQNSTDLHVISKVNIVKTIKHTKDVHISVFEIC